MQHLWSPLWAPNPPALWPLVLAGHSDLGRGPFLPVGLSALCPVCPFIPLQHPV